MIDRLTYLFRAFSSKTSTDEERLELAEYILKAENSEAINSLLEEAWQHVVEEDNIGEEKAESMFNSIIGKTSNAARMGPGGRVITLWKKLSVAASIILLIGAGAYIYYYNTRAHLGKIDHASVQEGVQDIPAPSSRAFLTLADGKKIFIDSIRSKAIDLQNGMKVRRLVNGQIAYESSGVSGNHETLLNILSNPKGSKVIDLLLSDGSKIWLNAGSSVEYPISFSGKSREVKITGEAYFEVAHDLSKPFIVRVNDAEIRVLGTHFNVMSYDDEEAIQTTLLEGSVKFSADKNSTVLKPGQQSQLTKSHELKLVTDVNKSTVMAWKNGMFSFEAERLETILRQLSRWYDVDIKYDKRTDDLFYLEMTRTVSLANILKVLELSSDIHFEIQGRTITVKAQAS